MFGLVFICNHLHLNNAQEILEKVQACSKEVDGKLIVHDLVTYAELAAVMLKAGFADDDDITIKDCQHAIRNFNQVNEVIGWATDEILSVMNPPIPN